MALVETLGVPWVTDGGGLVLVALGLESSTGTLYRLVGQSFWYIFDSLSARVATVLEVDFAMICNVEMFELWADCSLFHISFVLK